MILYGNFEYNLNVVNKEDTTELFDGLNENVKNCQDGIPFSECKTNDLLENVVEKCGCLPFEVILGQRNRFNITRVCSKIEIEACSEATIKELGENCVKNCAGVYVSSFDRKTVDKDIFKNFKGMLKEYNDYKGILEYPEELKSNTY